MSSHQSVFGRATELDSGGPTIVPSHACHRAWHPLVELAPFVQAPHEHTDEWRSVHAIAQQLHRALNEPDVLAQLTEANRPGQSSAIVQGVLKTSSEALGFESERKGLFADSMTGLRPDYYKRIGDTGILLEVERGKTTRNNMDLLDFWKCHLCIHAHYLFLFVPQELRHNAEQKSPHREFTYVQRRLSQFFDPTNYTNVRGLCVFGY